MPWWDGLSWETIQQLRNRHPDLEQAAVAAVRHPDYADDFARLGADILTNPDVDHIGRLREPHEPAEFVWFPRDNEQAGRTLLIAALLEDQTGERRKETRGTSEKGFDGRQVETAVRMWKLRGQHDPPTSQNAIAEATKLSRPAVRRIVRLVTVGALDWDEKRGRGWLGISALFRATPSTISLRALEKAHGLEPLG
jgi:hypothetical protein